MPEKNKLHKTSKNLGHLEDEEILELADEVLQTPDDEIVELTDMTDIPTTADEEEIIDLSEVADIPLEEDEEIMDLTENLYEPPAMDDGITELSDIAAETPPLDEEIMDLDDYLEDMPAGEEELLELDDVVDESGRDIFEKTSAAEAASASEVLELTESDREAIAEELNLDLSDASEDAGKLAEDSDQTATEMTDLLDEEQPLDASIEISDLDNEAAAEETVGEEPAEEDSDTVELTDLDSETIDKELGELALDLETAGQADTAEITPDQEIMEQDSALNLGAEMPDDTLELQDTDRVHPEPEELSEKMEPATIGDFELTDSDREIIDEELSLEFDDQPHTDQARFEDDSGIQEQELSLGLDSETEEEDIDIRGSDSGITDEGLTELHFEEPSAADAAIGEKQSGADEQELGVEFKKEETLSDSVGMTFDSDMEASENLAQMEESDDIYKTQEILDEISQFDSVEASGLHKQMDPISIRVQDPATENRLEIDALDQEAAPNLGSISSDQIEIAVERVVKKMFAEKIENILVEAIERTVKKEINRIKNILLDESSGDV